MRAGSRVPIFEFGEGPKGKIKIFERIAEWIYDTSKQKTLEDSKKLLIATIDSIPGDLEATLKEAAKAISGKHNFSSTKRWQNYRLRGKFVFITEGDLELYGSLNILDYCSLESSQEDFIKLPWEVSTKTEKGSGIRMGHYYLVNNPNRGKNISELLS